MGISVVFMGGFRRPHRKFPHAPPLPAGLKYQEGKSFQPLVYPPTRPIQLSIANWFVLVCPPLLVASTEKEPHPHTQPNPYQHTLSPPKSHPTRTHHLTSPQPIVPAPPKISTSLSLTNQTKHPIVKAPPNQITHPSPQSTYGTPSLIIQALTLPASSSVADQTAILPRILGKPVVINKKAAILVTGTRHSTLTPHPLTESDGGCSSPGTTPISDRAITVHQESLEGIDLDQFFKNSADQNESLGEPTPLRVDHGYRGTRFETEKQQMIGEWNAILGTDIPAETTALIPFFFSLVSKK